MGTQQDQRVKPTTVIHALNRLLDGHVFSTAPRPEPVTVEDEYVHFQWTATPTGDTFTIEGQITSKSGDLADDMNGATVLLEVVGQQRICGAQGVTAQGRFKFVGKPQGDYGLFFMQHPEWRTRP